jgi:hypothetical protein
MLRTILQIISWVAAIATVVPAFVYFVKGDPNVPAHLDNVKTAMLISTIVWFVVTPMWMGREKKPAAEQGPAGTTQA